MPRQAKPKDNTLLEMAIVGHQSELEKISARIAEINEQLGKRGPGRPKATARYGVGACRNGSGHSKKTEHDERSGPRQDRRRAESEMGGAEEAAGTTSHGSRSGEAQETEDVGGGVEGY